MRLAAIALTAVAVSVAAVAAPVGVGFVGPAPAGAAEIDDLRAAAAAARDAATQATAQYMEVVNRLEGLEVEIGTVEREISANRDTVAELGVLARARAVEAYTKRGVDTGMLSLDRPLDRVRREKLLHKANARDNSVIVHLEIATEQLDARERELRTLRDQTRVARDQLVAQQAVLDQQLREANQALNAFEERLRREEAARQERERALLAAQQQAQQRRTAAGAPVGGYVANGLICPLRGPLSFIDSWGYPRATTGRHQGSDLMSPRGTPNVAVVSGDVEFHTGGTSGLGAYLYGDDGNLYYYFHLQAYEGAARRVQQGEVIGYVGNTGDAIGTATHTHFEIHPGGGPAVNPYPTVAQIC